MQLSSALKSWAMEKHREQEPPVVLVATEVHNVLIEGLRELGYTVIYRPLCDAHELLQWLPKVEGLIVGSASALSCALLKRAARLRFIGRPGSGLDHIDTACAEVLGIRLFRSPEGNADAVAEHVVMALLAFERQLLKADRSMRQHQWLRRQLRGVELAGKCLGIIGCGHTGGTLAQKLSTWGMQILVYDKYKTAVEMKHRLPHIEVCDLEAVLKRSDYLSIHVPLTEETRHMVDRDFLRRMKRGSVLINTSRGGVLDLSALVEAMESGQLRGACVDVFEEENWDKTKVSADFKSAYERLASLPNTILTPHIAGLTNESLYKCSLSLMEKIALWRKQMEGRKDE